MEFSTKFKPFSIEGKRFKCASIAAPKYLNGELVLNLYTVSNRKGESEQYNCQI
jgi:hypothetical protein